MAIVGKRAALWEKGPNDQRLLRFLLVHCAIGLGVGLVFSLAFLTLDIAGLRSAMMATREGGLGVFMFCFATSFLFGSLAMGVAVMTFPKDPNYGRIAVPEDSHSQDRPDS